MRKVRQLWPLLAGALLLAACAPKAPAPPEAAPGVPTGVQASAEGTQVVVEWEPVPDATGYNLYWSTTPVVNPRTGNRLTDVTSPYVHRNLQRDQRYYYVVTAVLPTGESPPSAEVTARTAPPPPPPVTDLKAEAGAGEVRLTWRNPTGAEVAGVMLRRSPSAYPPNPRQGTPVAEVEGESYTDRGLTPGTRYYYTAFSYDTAGQYGPGVRAEATPEQPVRPEPVVGFAATPGDGEVRLQWEPPAWSEYTGTVIRRSTSSIPDGPEAGEAVADTTGTAYIDTGLENGVTYYYAAFAHDGHGTFARAATARVQPANVVPPAPVTDFRARRSAGEVALQWRNPPDEDFAGVMIRRRGDGQYPQSPNDGTLVVQAEPGRTRYTDRNVAEGQTYYYAAFSYDTARNYAPAARTTDAETVPFGLEEARLLADDTAPHDSFGLRVAIDGDYAVVGAFQHDGAGQDAGAAYIFHRTGGVWQQQAKLVPDDAAAFDRFGFAVAIDGNRVLVGAQQKDGDGPQQGAAYLFERQGETWAQRAKLLPAVPEARAWFGFSVALHGDLAVVGAPLHGGPAQPKTGAVYVFRRDGDLWLEQARLAPEGRQTGAFFGFSVALRGREVLVGAPLEDHEGQRDAGAAYLFGQVGTTWTQLQRLVPEPVQAGDLFGFAVALADRDALVSALFDDTAGTDAGAVYAFRRTAPGVGADGWALLRKLTATDARGEDAFGYSVALAADYAAIGAYQEDASGAQAGVAYIYRRDEDAWSEQIRLTASDARAGDAFGSVALSREYALIGASRSDAGGLDAGAVYVFH